jgi:hypothetical protein
MIARTLLSSFLGRVRAGRIDVAEGAHRLAFGPADAPLHAKPSVHDPSFWRALTAGSRGLARSYAAGVWDCDDLVRLVRIAAREVPRLDRLRAFWGTRVSAFRIGAKDTPEAAPAHVAAHYDLGNERLVLQALTIDDAAYEVEKETPCFASEMILPVGRLPSGRLGANRRFRRLFEFYFAWCEGGFLERRKQDIQLLFAKPASQNGH